MLSESVQPDLARAEDLIAQRAVRGKRVVALRMVRLVERELEIDGRTIERDVAIRGSGQIHRADRAHPEIGLHTVLGHSRAGHTHHDVMQERIVERPAPRAG